MTAVQPYPQRHAHFAHIADLLSRVVKMLGRTLTPEEVQEAIDAAFAQRPSQADMSALVAAFSTPPQPRDPAGRYQPHAANSLTPERRRALLGATTEGRAVLAAQEKHATDQQRDYPHIDKMTEGQRRQHLAAHAPDILTAQDEQATHAPWQTPRGHAVNNHSPAQYRHILGLTDMGRQLLREEDRVAREEGIPFARPIHDDAPTPTAKAR